MPAQLIIDGQVYDSSYASSFFDVYFAIRSIIDAKDTNQVAFKGTAGDVEVLVTVMVTEHTSVQLIVTGGDDDEAAHAFLKEAQPNVQEVRDLYGKGRKPLHVEDDGDWTFEKIED